MENISFNIPFLNENVTYDFNKLKKNNHFGSGGKFTKKCEQWLKRNIKCKDALLVHSCTAALEMCALLLNIKQNDEIIMPSFGFVTTANAFVLRGGIPVFVDVDPHTCNIDPLKIEQAITTKTKAIVVVHYAGISCDMDLIQKIVKKNKLFLIEDAAQAISSTYKGKPLGSMGDLSTISFHETKNIHCGEGGALLINNSRFIKRARIIKEKGTNRDLFNKNIVKKYTWVDYGSSYGLNEISAFFLYNQLKQAHSVKAKRLSLFNYYHKLLKKLETENFIKRPTIPSYAGHNAHIYYIITKSSIRNQLLKYLRKNKINTVFHYIPLHSSPFGKLKAKTGSSMKNTNLISKNLLRLPLHLQLSKIDIIRCTNEMSNFFKSNL